MAVLSRSRSQTINLLLVLGITAMTSLAVYLALNCRIDRAMPLEFAGQWQVVGIDGEFRGTATLAADGSVDTEDDYTGVWTADDTAVHLVMWKKRPHDSTGQYATRPDVQSLRIQLSPKGNIALSGDHVVLRRSADENS